MKPCRSGRIKRSEYDRNEVKNGNVLGFEKLNYLSGPVADRTVVFETAMV